MAETMFYILLPLTAFLYASVGHGGASGYLALMALFSFSPEVMKPTALLLNLFVAGISFVQFARAGHFQWRLFFVFAVLSIPLSFLGGMMELDPQWYKFTLGVLLLFAIARMIGLFDKEKMSLNELNWPIGILVGGSIGFFSGLIGIGGGIILSPVILLLRWGSIKEAAAVSALFIWVNSLAGLAGQLRFGFELSPNIWLMAGLTLIGGFAGGTAGSFFVGKKQMKLILSVVLILASVKLIFT
jgi:uncharacterized membrane protein YfcA